MSTPTIPLWYLQVLARDHRLTRRQVRLAAMLKLLKS